MIFRWLLLLVPVALVLRYLVHAPPLVVFAAAILAIVPLAEWIRRATEQLAHVLGSTLGGLLNVTFGNVAELILAIFVLLDGNAAVVKGQITGSIIGNSLLGLGLAVVVGGWGKEKQTFDRGSAGRLSSLLILCVIALLLPAFFDYTERAVLGSPNAGVLDHRLSIGVSVVLISVYALNLLHTLVTHRDVFECAADASEPAAEDEQRHGRWSVKRALGVLVLGTVVTAWMAELVSGALEPAAGSLGVSTFFLGVVVLAVVGNAAEYVSAVYFARRGRMTMVMGITVGSTIQVALLVAPVLVLVSHAIGRPMTLVFTNPIELIAIACVAFIVNAVAHDGETTWFEGVLLLGVYLLLVLAFLLVLPAGDTGGGTAHVGSALRWPMPLAGRG